MAIKLYDMKCRYLLMLLTIFSMLNVEAQSSRANFWADSVFKTLSKEEKIAQLMVVRLSTIDGKTKKAIFLEDQVTSLINDYNIGGICLFQGNPVEQAETVNRLQAIAKTPLMVCIDAEWGVGMRMTDSVLPLPRQMMLGAMQAPGVVYQYGRLVGEQCKRVGIQVNYAPVVDINNNPNNPVINDRSFGEDKYKVASYGIQYMKGMQDVGVMACAKHFPGHGDVDVDSHYDLPVINKSMAQLDSLELFPFRQIFNAGVGSVMIAHLYIPAIDKTANRATSLSPNNIKGLLRDELNYQGLTFTDALEMQGVKKFFPDGEASVQSLIAGNDMLCLPGDVPLAIKKIKEAIDAGKLSWDEIDTHCKKVLLAKYEYGMHDLQPIATDHLTEDLNAGIPAMRRLVAENAITLAVKKNDDFFPLSPAANNKAGDVALIVTGTAEENLLAQRMKTDYNATVFYVSSANKIPANADVFVNKIKKEFKKVVIAVHNLSRSPATNFGLDAGDVALVNKLQKNTNSIILQFGNAYAAKNWCDAANLMVCYEDDEIIQQVALEMLEGKLPYKGLLPVTVCNKLPFGTGIITIGKFEANNQWRMNMDHLQQIDSIAKDAIAKKAIPGCVVLAVKDGKIAFEKAYGSYTYDGKEPVNIASVYDMASVTKICATTISVMKLYDQGKISLDKTLGDYLPYVRGTNKEKLRIDDILLHQAGLVSYIPFYKETVDAAGKPLPAIYSTKQTEKYSIPVARELYLDQQWEDSIKQRILRSPLGPRGKYVYSDNDFIFLGKIVEQISGLTLDEFARKQFYTPMSLESIGFLPLQHHDINRIVPTEDEAIFRKQLLRGFVHDPGAAMFGGIAGHAGLFSNAYDIAAIMQMLMDGGTYNGRRYLQQSTVDLFTKYQSSISRRGYGFDKPEKDNSKRNEPYPTLSASAKTFGHTGFTGTCVWADPESKLIFVFLSNRVNPTGSNLFLQMNVRPKIHETLYEAIKM